MRNAKNPARSYLHQAYLHVRHLSRQDRLEHPPRSIAEGPALLGVSGVPGRRTSFRLPQSWRTAGPDSGSQATRLLEATVDLLFPGWVTAQA
jgi:hypothetical protein